ncbi:MAG: cysteine--tRNA ligase [Nitrosopumilus sp. H8]|nr:MAG: cysteine--tRNA ligase [Nitrosopumilus sp. H13]RNJ80212.1 MAG: cysteine--tRNA ligase [Nitrosopumilus sp. H8]
MDIQDTLSNSKKRLDAQKVRIYLCGVTVYDDSHIGHARTIIVFDVLRRYLESAGAKVELVQNFTDVDDKIIDRARAESSAAGIVSGRYIESYFRDFDELNVMRADSYPKATEHIGEIIDYISTLEKKGAAYSSANGVYFAVSAFSRYGVLSKKKIDELQSGARIEVDESKKDPLDFALWKFSKDDPSWDSPWGRGRPGWHIECSAMSTKYLGENFEIHGGGRDLIFPHHENEMAQTETCTGAPFAKIWMHVGMVTINGEKMAKSTGNVRSVRRVLDEWGPNIIRLFCLSGHYSKPIDYTEDLLCEDLAKWRQAETCYFELIHAGGPGGGASGMVKEMSASFDAALRDDLNTHLALSAFFGMVKVANKMAAEGTLGGDDARAIRPELERMMGILGLSIPEITQEEIQEIDGMITQREELRKEKKFSDADRIRDEISGMGVELLDHGHGTVWVRREKIRAEN